ncbi:MAG TPA: ABC transporter permease subunit [Planctomycetota bacterium]|nr:ABC transporter permease subunit [Planctomycetota bacterium]
MVAIGAIAILCLVFAPGAVLDRKITTVDDLLMRSVDILYSIPFMFFVIILLVNFGRNLILLFFALGAVEWLTMARIVRGQVLSLKEKEFIEAARVSGTGTPGIIFGHLVPNSLGAVIVYTTLTIPEVILTEAFLSFLGLSVQYEGQNLESWGSLTKSGMDLALGGFPWLLAWSALALSMTLFALNFLGDGLRDALDPRLRGRG